MTKKKPTPEADCEIPAAGEEPSTKLRAKVVEALDAVDRADWRDAAGKLRVAMYAADLLAYAPTRQRMIAQVRLGMIDSPAGAGADVEAERG